MLMLNIHVSLLTASNNGGNNGNGGGNNGNNNMAEEITQATILAEETIPTIVVETAQCTMI